MGWRGTLRSIAAAQRQAERAAVRRQRELERQHKQYAKMLELEAAEYEVEVYQNRIEVLQSIHIDCGEPLDWREIRDAPEPVPPTAKGERERQAQREFAGYQPGILDKLLRRVETRRAALALAVQEAKNADAAAHAQAVSQYRKDHADWQERRALADRVLTGEITAYLEVVQDLNPFGEMGSLGSSVAFTVPDGGSLDISVAVHAEDVIPQEVKSLTKGGKLSVKKMPQGQFYELYQDYVCGCLLRIARETFALLPVQLVIVTALGDVLDTATGHIEERPILSVAIPRSSLVRLNFETLDPSDSLKNFIHRMNFKKTKGFAAVERIQRTELQQPA